MTDDSPKEPTGPRGEVDPPTGETAADVLVPTGETAAAPPAATGETASDAPDAARPAGAREPTASSVEASPQAFEPQPSSSVAVSPQTARSSSADEPILPSAYDESVLRDAVGPPPPRRRRPKRDEASDDGSSDRPHSRRAIAIIAIAIVVGLAIAVLALLGHVNAQRYLIACSTDHVSAEQGRSFPPWGSRPLAGPAWKPIPLPPNAECKARETEDRAELERWFLELLIERASTTLAARDLLDAVQPGKAHPLDVVAAQLDQALLLSRAPERRDQRKEVERLLGDVQYWRASLHLRNAAAGLAEAARQFEAAAARRPRHVTDAAEWAAFLRRLVDDLHAGPGGVPAGVAPSEPSSHDAHGERASAPLGTALPVEPEPSDATNEQPAAPAPEAGLPTGGVLL